jgi:hypothetical protein
VPQAFGYPPGLARNQTTPVSAFYEVEQAEGIMNTHRMNRSSAPKPTSPATSSLADRSALREEEFLQVIWHERKRAERSQRSCLLMLIEMDQQFPAQRNGEGLGTILSALSAATRETDVTGWYVDNSVVGVLFTEIACDGASIVTAVMTRVSDALRSRLGSRQFNQANISFQLFPEEGEEKFPPMSSNAPLFTRAAAAANHEARGLVER